MHVRRVTRADLAELVDVACEAFRNDELYNYLHPHLAEFPLSFWRFVCLRNVMRFIRPGQHGFVCVTDGSDPIEFERGRIMGYMWCSRQGPADDPNVIKWNKVNTDLLTRLDAFLVGVQDSYNEFFRMNKSAEYARAQQWRHHTATIDPFKTVPEQWYIDVLGVHPKYQRRGVGRALLKWPLETARKEGVPATLLATRSGRLMYPKLGFKICDWLTLEDIIEAGDGAAMVCDPDQKYTRPAKGDECVMELHGEKRAIEVVIDLEADKVNEQHAEDTKLP